MKKVYQKLMHIVAGVALVLVVSNAWALGLKEAKSSGFVKENSTGYLEVVSSDNQNAVALVKEVNAKRKAKYTEIAKRNKISVSSVEKQAAKKLKK